MISEDLKSRIDTLSPEERHQLAAYLTKLELESNSEYWETIRRRTTDTSSAKWVPADQL